MRALPRARSERLEDRLEASHRRLLAANHQAVPAFDSPDAAAHADIDVMNTSGFQLFRATNIVDIVRVSAVDDHVAWLELWRERSHRLCRPPPAGTINHTMRGVSSAR